MSNFFKASATLSTAALDAAMTSILESLGLHLIAAATNAHIVRVLPVPGGLYKKPEDSSTLL